MRLVNICLVPHTQPKMNDKGYFNISRKIQFLTHLSWKLKTCSEFFWLPVVHCPSVCLLTFLIFILFSRTTGPISTKLGTKILWWREFGFLQIRTIQFSKKRCCFFSSSNQFYVIFHSFAHLFGFSGEWCGPWASCLKTFATSQV